jgi:hypothetical protein
MDRQDIQDNNCHCEKVRSLIFAVTTNEAISSFDAREEIASDVIQSANALHWQIGFPPSQ